MLLGVFVLFGFLPFVASAQAASTSESVEAQVHRFFADAPVMVEIARCESKFRQFADSGNPLYGGYLNKMIGIFQFYADIHAATAKALGFDLETVDGQLGYARHIYEKQGTDPWLSSISCWGGTPKAEAATQTLIDAVPATGANSTALTKNLSLGMIDPEMKTVQQILNSNGYMLAPDGPGSPGQETEKYGALTRVAIRAFQCAQHIACDGDEYSTGYGFIGPRTRAALLTVAAAHAPAPVASVPPPPPEPSPAASTQTAAASSAGDSIAVQIAVLQAQIAELMKKIAELQNAQLVQAVTDH